MRDSEPDLPNGWASGVEEHKNNETSASQNETHQDEFRSSTAFLVGNLESGGPQEEGKEI